MGTDDGGPRVRDALPRGRRASWRFIRKVWAETSQDHVILLAAGVAFFAFVSIFPSLVAIGLIYGLFSDPDQVADQVDSVSDFLPEGADETLVSQLENLTQLSGQGFGLGLLVSLATALWAASTATSNLLGAVNAAYDHTLRRNFAVRRALGLAMTLGGIAFVTIAIAMIAVAPAVLDALDLPGWASPVLWVIRWLALVIFVGITLAIVYRVGPNRQGGGIRWASPGAVVGTTLWIAASGLFSLYAGRFADYGAMYGPLSGVIVLLLWLWLGAVAALIGAEVNAEIERRLSIADAASDSGGE